MNPVLSGKRIAIFNGTQQHAGDLDLGIPKLRSGSFFPVLLERRRRIDQALYAAIMEVYVHGVSTRSVDDLVKALGADTGISNSEVSPGSVRTWTASGRVPHPAPGPLPVPVRLPRRDFPQGEGRAPEQLLQPRGLQLVHLQLLLDLLRLELLREVYPGAPVGLAERLELAYDEVQGAPGPALLPARGQHGPALPELPELPNATKATPS
jgi:hypothetical protein